MDTGMLRAVYKGTPSAIELSGDQIKALYPDSEEVLTQPPAKPIANLMLH